MFQAPSAAGLPHLSTLLDSIPGTPKQLARHLGISARTLARYRRAGQAPRAIMLALFWESPWGCSYAHTAAFNDARIHAALSASLRAELDRLRGQLARLLADYHAARAANDPLQLGQVKAGHALEVGAVGGDQGESAFQALRRDQGVYRAARDALAEQLGRFQGMGAGDGLGGHSVGQLAYHALLRVATC